VSVDSISPYLRQQHNQRRRIPGPRREDWDIPASRQLEEARRVSQRWWGRGRTESRVRLPNFDVAVSATNEWRAAVDEVTMYMGPLSADGEPVEIISIVPRWKRILQEVSSKHRVTIEEIISHRRNVPAMTARREAIWRIKNETTLSYPQIGKKFGGRDHSTIIHALKKYEEAMAKEAG
jgi:hypothetical protein